MEILLPPSQAKKGGNSICIDRRQLIYATRFFAAITWLSWVDEYTNIHINIEIEVMAAK